MISEFNPLYLEKKEYRSLFLVILCEKYFLIPTIELECFEIMKLTLNKLFHIMTDKLRDKYSCPLIHLFMIDDLLSVYIYICSTLILYGCARTRLALKEIMKIIRRVKGRWYQADKVIINWEHVEQSRFFSMIMN